MQGKTHSDGFDLLASLTKAIQKLMVLLLIVAGAFLALSHFYAQYQMRKSWEPWGGFDPKTIPTPKPGLRIALTGRPVELPIKALARLPETSRIHLEYRTVNDPVSRFEMMAAGTVDMTIASLDELALAFPRFQPGFIIFPAAENRGAEGVVENEKADPGNELLGFLGGGTSEALARAVPGRHFRVVGPDSPEKTLEELKNGQLRAASLWQPYLSQAQKDGAKLLYDTKQRPTTEVWLVSRRLMHNELQGRAQPSDVRTFAKAWFLFIDQLESDKDLAVKALAAENDLTPEKAQSALQGLTFLSLASLKSRGDRWVGETGRKLESELTFWSLSGAPNQKGAKFEEAVDASILGDLLLTSGDDPATPATPDVSPTPGVAPTPAPAAGDSSMLGFDPAHQGISPGPALMEMNQQAWTINLGAEIATGMVPIASQNLVVCGGDDKRVHAIDIKTGSERWNFTANEVVRSTPAVLGSRVYVGSNDARLYALDAKSGGKLWAYQAQTEVVSSPVVADGRVYCASQDGTVFCVDAEKGEEQWKYNCSGNVTSSPAVADGILVVGCFDGSVYGLSLETGEKIWTHKTKGVIQASPCISGGKVFIGSLDKNFYALRLSNGAEIWKKTTGGEIATSAACDQGIVTFGSRDSTIYGCDADSGKELWKYPARERLSSGAIICQGLVYIGSEDKRIYVINLDKGTLRYHNKFEGWVQTPLVWQQAVFVASESHAFCLK